MAKANFRFTIDVSGIPRKILSIALRKNGDLVLDVKPAPNFRADPYTTKVTDRYSSYRISIHRSSNSNTGNLCTYTLVLASGSTIRKTNFTTAIKTHRRFAPLPFRRFPNLSTDEFAADDRKTESLSLGRLDTKFFNLIVGVFIGPADRPFISKQPNIQIVQKIIGDFNLVIIATFLSLPSVGHGETMLCTSTKPNPLDMHSLPNPIDESGYDELRAYVLFQSFALELYETCLNHTLEVALKGTDRAMLRAIGRMFPRGETDALDEIRAHFDIVKMFAVFHDKDGKVQ